jgi:hypothetical protein
MYLKDIPMESTKVSKNWWLHIGPIVGENINSIIIHAHCYRKQNNDDNLSK